jgi:fimbrial chaperone protein
MPHNSATLRLRNDADRPMSVQVRVFRWTQVDGVDRYEPTTAVVASPPSTRMNPKVDYTLRVVRVSKTPITSEESYRLIIDELPTNLVKRSGTINLVMRHSIPVFFKNPQTGQPKVSWKLANVGGALKLVAENAGGTRLKLADLSIHQGNAALYRHRGLVGYVLAGAKMEWPVSLRQKPSASVVTLKAKSQLGVFDENIPVIGR